MLLFISGQAISHAKIYTNGNYRYIESDGLPEHNTGQFPNSGNPNSISSQSYHYRVPLHPTFAGSMTEVQRGNFGIATNGVPFDPGTAEYYQGNRNWRYEAMTGFINLGIDMNNAHVQPNGAYHYHGLPEGLLSGNDGRKHSPLVGWAADGFPIYAIYGYANPLKSGSVKALKSSYGLKSGSRNGGPGGSYDGRFVQDFKYYEGKGDLDECNGRIGITPEFPNGTYYYVLSEDFPFVPRCYRGTPDPSFQKAPHGAGGGAGPGGSRRQMGYPPHPHPYQGGYGPRGDSTKVAPRFSFFGYERVY